jgi:hypothetical protein
MKISKILTLAGLIAFYANSGFSQTSILTGLTAIAATPPVGTTSPLSNINDADVNSKASGLPANDAIEFQFNLPQSYLISDPTLSEITVKAQCYGVYIYVRVNDTDPWVPIGNQYGSTTTVTTKSFDITYPGWIKQIKFRIYKYSGAPSQIDVYDIKVYGTNVLNDQFFGRIGISTQTLTQNLTVNGNTSTKKLVDYDNENYFLDMYGQTGISLNVAGDLQARKFWDSENTALFLDPSSTATSLNALGDLYGKSFKDYNNSTYYLDPDNTSTSLNVAGQARANLFVDVNSPTYYLDPSLTGTSLNVAGGIYSKNVNTVETDADNPLVFKNSDGGYQYISFYNGSTRNGWIGIDNATNNNRMVIKADNGRDIYIEGANFRVLNGKVYAREVQVLNGAFPDYVFHKNYHLRSLNELDSYIKENGHLPEVPSAKEVEENGGVNLGEMNTILLKKVEELTLYVIDLEKKNAELDERIKSLEKE